MDPADKTRPQPQRAPSSPAPRLGAVHVDGRLFANRTHLLRSLDVSPGGRVAEVGVGLGGFSRVMLDALRPARFDAIDLYNRHEFPAHWARRTGVEGQDRTHRQFYEARFAAEIDDGAVTVMEGDSATLLSEVPDGSYDLIYIDGDHSYEGVKRDAEAATQKIKPSGVLVFNDYIMYNHIVGIDFGVVHVVNQLCVEQGWGIIGFALQPAMFCDVALSRRQVA